MAATCMNSTGVVRCGIIPDLSHGSYLYELTKGCEMWGYPELSHGSYLYELNRGCEMWGYPDLSHGSSWQLLV